MSKIKLGSIGATAVPTYRDLITSEQYFTYAVTPQDSFDIYTGNNGFIVSDDTELDVEQVPGTILINVDWETYDRQPS